MTSIHENGPADERSSARPFSWSGRRVLVTGHTGFKGGWLSVWLQRSGARVVGLSLEPPTSPSLYQVARVGEGMTSVIGDVRDGEFVRQVIDQHRPEVIFHLAAQAIVRESYREPVDTLATNVVGTANVLDAARRVPEVRAILNVTSDKCYENREWLWGYREHEPMGGKDPYSASKGCAELVTAAFRASFFSGDGAATLASARAGNVIGGGDWAADRLVPDIIRAMTRGEPVEIRNPAAVRPWQHVLEPVSGYLALGQALLEEGAAFAEGWNFGPLDHDTQPVRWVAEQLTRLWSPGSTWVSAQEADAPPEARYLRLDSTKARTRLGWRPRLDLPTALQWVVEWHRDHLDGRDMRAVTEDQIARYLATDEPEEPVAGSLTAEPT